MQQSVKRWCFVLVLLIILVAATACAAPRLKLIPASNPDYVYAGRIDFSNPDAPKFYWAGNSATIGFTGRNVSVVLDAPDEGAYFDIILDGDGAHRQVIRCRKGRHAYLIAADLADTRHTVEIFRRVDPTYPAVAFDGIQIAETGDVLRLAPNPSRRIVFYGDSITSGYGVLDPPRNHAGDAAYMDNYVAYDAVAARALHADYRSISLSGIGIMRSWFPLVMPDMYDRLAPRDPASHWDFSSWVPDFVVVNLLQNDSWLLPHEPHPPSREKIIAAYVEFVRDLRRHYPHAAIICLLGNMDITAAGSPWPGYVQAAVQRMHEGGDHNLYSLIVPFKHTPGHPNVAEQAVLAHALIGKIRSIEVHAANPARN